MKTALIGYTGFVGSNLASRHQFDGLYNTQNISEIVGQSYDLVVSAGNRADSYRINRSPADDLDEIDGLIEVVSEATIARLVLVSTVCVYPGGVSPDEETPLTDAGLTPYGQNRLHQERRFNDRFDTTILRLPQLYGDNLKKGLIFDLSNDYRVEFIDPDGSFQYYDVRRLWDDLQIALDDSLPSLNLASPPISHSRVARELFGVDISGNRIDKIDPFSDMYTREMRTIHDQLFGSHNGYLRDIESELSAIHEFARVLTTNHGRV